MDTLLSVSSLALMSVVLSFATKSYSPEFPTVHFDPTPALLPVKKGKNQDEIEHVSIKTLLETRCPTLFTPFKPLWWLFNGHLQTLYCIFGDFSKNDRTWYYRQYLRLADGGTLGLDFAPADQSKVAKDSPIIVVQHGLTGGSYESYVRAMLSRACAPKEEGGLGYRAVVVNFRGCAGVPVTSPLLYSAGHTDDIRQALLYIAHQFPDAKLLGLGFSLGSNILTRYLGEEGHQTRVHAACVLSCPWDLKQNNHGLSNSFTGKHIYSKGIGGNLFQLMKKHLNALVQDPEHHVAKAAREALKLKNPTLEKFDDTFSRIASGPAPYFPFPDADAYYVWGSSHNMVERVTVPFLSINAVDDPIVRHVPMDGGGNSLVVMELTTGGGHVGWFQAGKGYVDRWTTKPVLEWLRLVGEDIVYNPTSKAAPIFIDCEGFLREKGREGLGCKPIEGGGVIDGNGGEDGMIQGL